jgi:cytosine/adenosine deaminase-related metal-dependent hydrolase
MPVEDVLKMGTIGGSRAIDLGDQISSPEEGKIADIIFLDDGGSYAAPMWGFKEDDIVKRLASYY